MDKPAVVTADIQPQVQTEPSTKANEKRKTVIKYVVISLSAVAITVAVITGFILTFRYHVESTDNIIKRTITEGNRKETIEENKSENTKLYTVYDEDNKEQKVLYDFNRRLKLIKSNGMCFVAAMNATEKDVEAANGNIDMGGEYRLDKTPVADKSFLSKQGQSLCAGESVFWIFPWCNPHKNISSAEDTGVSKRATGRAWCWPCYYHLPYCCYVQACGRRWTSCYCRMIVIATWYTNGPCYYTFIWDCPPYSSAIASYVGMRQPC
eukprot:TRINITY_DN25977_c0_g1_i1.p1 TRINITY_DN25977_c0_g1~~TRINITY_DN25977_c0_g1_i1.p1  ORF type:complete len:288 (+),score=14.58 TRINITY_DN25977_c0_g1_i1:69-866(+)